jgi:hypothetical protein
MSNTSAAGKLYAYFNTGQKDAKAVYARLPPPTSADFEGTDNE